MTATAYAKKFGGEIRADRKALELTLEDVTAATGFSVSALSDWENGKKQIKAYDKAVLKAFFRTRKAAASAKAGGRLRHG